MGMGKRKAGEPDSDQPATGRDAAPASPPATEPHTVESPQLVPPQGEAITPQADPPIAPAATDIKIDALDAVASPAAEHSRLGRAISAIRGQFTPLAAMLATAACIGAVGGALATAGIGQLFSAETAATTETTATTATAANDDARALRDSVAKLGADLAALKSTIAGSTKTASGQIAKLGERIDRVEKAQAEPAARLAKLSEAIERIEKRVEASPETTGSIPARAAPPLPPARPANLPIVDGWVLRDVINGSALVQGRMGMLDVIPGDALPGLGRVEAIRRQDGRWVVVTAKGLIVGR